MSVVGRLAPSPAVFVGTCLVLGLVVGSFLNVVIYRLPVMLDRAWREQCRDLSGEAAAATLPAGLPARFNLVVPRSACPACRAPITALRSEEHTSELQSQSNLVCRLLLEKKKKKRKQTVQSKSA